MQVSGASASVEWAGPAARVIIRSIVYYAILIGGTTLAWRWIPHASGAPPASLDALLGGGPPASRGTPTDALGEGSLALTVAVAMLAAVLLTLPVAWVYLVTRAKRGYQYSAAAGS